MRTLAALLLISVPAWNGDPFAARLSDSEKIDHALHRLTFGPRPGDAERVAKLGLKNWIGLQLNPARIAENEDLRARLSRLDTLNLTSAELTATYPPPQLIRAMADGRVPLPRDPERRAILEKQIERYKSKGEGDKKPASRESLVGLLTRGQWRTLRGGTPAERLKLIESLPEDKQIRLIAVLPREGRTALLAAASPELRRRMQGLGNPYQAIALDLNEGKILRAAMSERQLEELLVDFWFNHFNVFFDKGADRYLIASYERDAIRPHVLGKFQDMLLATAQHPAMLFYLDNWQSSDPSTPARGRGRGPRGLNENYARELMELHTLGVDGGYTQKDVTEVARCLTGWTMGEPFRGGGFEFNARMHDKGEKTVLGTKIPAGGGIEDGLTVIGLLARHPSTAKFVSYKLAVRFVADDPPQALVARMAATFTKTGGDLRAVMQTMLDAREFWSRGAYRAKVKTPLEMVASALRATEAKIDFTAPLAKTLADLGQPLYRKQEPTGYSAANAEWVNSAALLGRMNFALALAKNQTPGVRVGQADGAKLGAPEFQRR